MHLHFPHNDFNIGEEVNQSMFYKYLFDKGYGVKVKSLVKKVGALDGDSAGTLAYNKGWKIIDDSYAFSNAIRF